MADLLIRDIEPELKRLIQARAKAHARSLSAESKALLRKALAQGRDTAAPASETGFGSMLRAMVDDIGGVELELPPRDRPERPVPDFS